MKIYLVFEKPSPNIFFTFLKSWTITARYDNASLMNIFQVLTDHCYTPLVIIDQRCG